MATPEPNDPPPLTVVSLHGIRTRGEWQKSLSRLLSAQGIIYDPWDYGFFKALSLVNPLSRAKQVSWFRDKYTALRKETNGPISIIVHSFGSYILAASLREFHQIKFDRIILCGSIIERDYDWRTVIARGQVTTVLNQSGRKDIWVRIAQWFVPKAGPSGYDGFLELADGKVQEQGNRSYGHSDYFFELNYRSNWIPFLSGQDAPKVPELKEGRRNWRYSVVVVLILAALTGLAYAVVSAFKGNDLSDRAPVGAPLVGLATLVDQKFIFLSDVPCRLSVDSADSWILIPEAPREQTLAKGKHIVSCSAVSDASVSESHVIEAGSMQKRTLGFWLQDKIRLKQAADLDVDFLRSQAQWLVGEWVWEGRVKDDARIAHCYDYSRRKSTITFLPFKNGDREIIGTINEFAYPTVKEDLDNGLFGMSREFCDIRVKSAPSRYWYGKLSLNVNRLSVPTHHLSASLTKCTEAARSCEMPVPVANPSSLVPKGEESEFRLGDRTYSKR